MRPLGEFVYHRRVQYRETDTSGIVHFSSFFVYAEEAEHAMWRSVGLSVESSETAIGWPRVSASFDFFAPLRFENEFDVRLRVVGRTAKTFRYQAVVMHGEEIAAIGFTTSICVRKIAGEPLKAIDIPPDVASRFEVVAAVDAPIRGRPTASDLRAG